MKMFREICLLVVCVAFFGWTVRANANLLVNGSFENVFDGVHWTGNVITAGSSAGFHPSSATDGDYIVGFGGGASPPPPPGFLSQEVSTAPGQQYGLEFDYGVYGDPVAQSMQVTVAGQSTVLEVVVSHTSSLGHTIHAWQTETFTFTADSALSTLRFLDVSTSGSSTDSALDRILIVAIPEPSTSLLFTLGLIGMSVSSRRRMSR